MQPRCVEVQLLVQEPTQWESPGSSPGRGCQAGLVTIESMLDALSQLQVPSLGGRRLEGAGHSSLPPFAHSSPFVWIGTVPEVWAA